MYGWIIGSALLCLVGCGRYFPGPLQPAAQQDVSMQVNDDGSVTYTQGRLDISLRAMTDDQLNRQFSGTSTGGGKSTNPYTYGNWKPLGENWTPARFTVFWLEMSNYAYPKVQLDPDKTTIVATNRRHYRALRIDELSEYYRAYALGLTGNSWSRFKERTDILRRTLYPNAPLFSGQDNEGYLVFPPLDDDVVQLTVTLKDIVLRFNYANEPVETLDLDYVFARDVVRGLHPPAEWAGGN